MATKKTAKKSARASGRFALAIKRATHKAGSDVRITRTSDGKLIINGTRQGKLVNQHPEVKVLQVKMNPTHLSKKDVSEIVKSMKVA